MNGILPNVGTYGLSDSSWFGLVMHPFFDVHLDAEYIVNFFCLGEGINGFEMKTVQEHRRVKS